LAFFHGLNISVFVNYEKDIPEIRSSLVNWCRMSSDCISFIRRVFLLF